MSMLKKAAKHFSVQVQKGPVVANQKTSKMMTYPEKVKDRRREQSELRDGMELKFHTPKR